MLNYVVETFSKGYTQEWRIESENQAGRIRICEIRYILAWVTLFQNPIGLKPLKGKPVAENYCLFYEPGSVLNHSCRNPSETL